jgi:hypothetical protein
MRIVLLVSVIVMGTIGKAAEARLKLRPEGATAITKRTTPLPTVDRVEIYVTGPKWDVEKTGSVAELRKTKAENILTNRGEIAQLLTRLRTTEEKAFNKKLKVRDGYTYHLLAYNDREGTVMYIRVLDSGDTKHGAGAEVYPDPTSSFSYLNDKIGPWLQANVLPKNPGKKQE